MNRGKYVFAQICALFVKSAVVDPPYPPQSDPPNVWQSLWFYGDKSWLNKGMYLGSNSIVG